MSNLDAFTRARGLIRETVTDPPAWPVLLAHLSEMTDADGAWLARAASRTPDLPCTPSLNEMLADYYAHGWVQADERVIRCVPRFKAGQPIVSDTDIAEKEECKRNQFYNDFALRHDFPYFTAASISSGPDVSDLWAVSFLRRGKAGHFEAAERQLISLLLDDLRNAAATARLLGSNTVKTLGRTLDLDDRPAVAIDARSSTRTPHSTCYCLRSAKI